jgi:uncharacterized membrane protein
MTLYRMILSVHILAGTIALASFWTAATLRKGSGKHRAVGQTFLLAMLVVAVSGVYIASAALARGQTVLGSFLMYIVLITATPCWLAWRAVRDKHDVKRFVGPVYHAFAWVNIAAGLIMLVQGIRYEQFLIAAVSAVGLATGPLMLRFARRLPTDRQWWLARHYSFMLGAGVATHVAFLNIGFTRMLPPELGTTAQRLSWFLPFVVAFAARVWLGRKYTPAKSATTAKSPIVMANTELATMEPHAVEITPTPITGKAFPT